MKAIGYFDPHPIEHPESLVDIELPDPEARGRDLLIEVRAVSVNPIDVKVRSRIHPAAGQPVILGWDAAGVVRAVGEKVTRFKVGDRVWYAGERTRAGSNAELQLVDEQLVGLAPSTLDFAEAAAMPLTSITAWELLFDRLKVQTVDPTRSSCLLVVGAAGGVGSVLLQLARGLTGLKIVATASRDETQAWVLERGAHHVINHNQPWRPQLEQLGIGGVTHVIGLNQTESYLQQIADVLVAEGQLALIDEPKSLDILPFRLKSISVHWESIFTRSLYKTHGMARQGDTLNRLAELMDAGVLVTSLTSRILGINAVNLKAAHAQIESGTVKGKIVLESR